MKGNIQNTQGYANIGVDLTAANAAADLAEIQYRKGGASDEQRDETARVLYTALGRHQQQPPQVPAVPAEDEIPDQVRRRASTIAGGAHAQVRDMPEPGRPAVSDPVVKELEKPLKKDKGWSMLEHIGIPATDVDQADTPDDVIEYVKASIPDD